MIKKLFIISCALLALVLFFMAVYNFAYRTQDVEGDDISMGDVLGILGGERKMKPGAIKEITDFPNIGATLGSDNSSVIFFGKENSKLYRYSLVTGKKKTLLQRELSLPESVIWSPSKKTVLISSSSDNGKYFSMDVSTGNITPLFTDFDIATWMSIGERIVYKKFDTETNTRGLYVADINGREEKKIVDVPFRFMNLEKVPESSSVAYWNIPSASQQSELFVVSEVNQQPNKIVSGMYGADFLWSPNGSQIIMSHTNEVGGTKTTLALINERGEDYQDLEIPTLVSKCAWAQDGETLYYALPESFPENAKLPDDYHSGAIKTIDTIWKMNTISGRRDRLVDFKRLKKEFDVTDMFVTRGGDKLIFTNRTDGHLYILQLPY